MEDRKRHTIAWNVLRPMLRTAAKLVFDYDCDVCREKGPLFILSNHNADLDPIFVVSAFPKPVYFVASEHLLRTTGGRILNRLTDLIPRQKGGSAGPTIRKMLEHINTGYDVCMFPEGNRSWDGVTRPISPTTGKVVRDSGAKLVTYRTEGLYFTNPRWSGGSLRRGRTHGTLVGVYEPEYLNSLTAEQVQEIIDRDLHENAYERQRKTRIRYKGKRLAEHLETLLFICPHCGAVGKMRSEGDYFICKECGTKLRYTPECFFVGENCVFDTVIDWNIWQNDIIREKCLAAGENEPIFSDTGMELYTVRTGEGTHKLAVGTMTLFRDRLELPGQISIELEDIYRMSIRGPQDLYFRVKDTNYFIKSEMIRCVVKYLNACSVFNERLKYGI